MYQFIDKWFTAELDLQQKLKVALEQDGKERIRDMTKNPLLLTLLCYSWQFRQGELPETKAEVYEWFVDTFYRWNKGKASVNLNSSKRQALNYTLGELAKTAIDRESFRFRLCEKLINQYLGDADDEDSLFYLALQIGWLNPVGFAAEDTSENVFAFLHPTFQEYFAALAISNGDYFLNHTPHQTEQASYRAFSMKWKESLLIWMGRKDVLDRQKELLLNALITFDEEYEQRFYFYRCYFIAAEAVSEFPNSVHTEAIVKQIFDWAFGAEKQCHSCITEEAKQYLLRTHKESAINCLVSIFNSDIGVHKLCQIAEILGQIKSSQSMVIQRLIEKLNSIDSEDVATDSDDIAVDAMSLLYAIGEISSDNKESLTAIFRFLHKRRHILAIRVALLAIGKIDKSSAIVILNRFLSDARNEFSECEFAEILGIVNPESWKIFWIFSSLLESENEDVVYNVLSALEVTINEKNIEVVVASKLIDCLVSLIHDPDCGSLFHQEIARIFGKFTFIDEGIAEALSFLINDSNDDLVNCLALESFLNLTQFRVEGLQILEFLIIMLKSKDREAQHKAAQLILQLDPVNIHALNKLLDLVMSNQSTKVYDPVPSNALNTLCDCIQISQDNLLSYLAARLQQGLDIDSKGTPIFDRCFEGLWNCAQNMNYLDFYHAIRPQVLN